VYCYYVVAKVFEWLLAMQFLGCTGWLLGHCYIVAKGLWVDVGVFLCSL